MIKKILATCFGKAYYNAACTYRQIKTFLYSIIKPYQYKAERYQNTFLKNSSSIEERNLMNEKVDKTIYLFRILYNDILLKGLKGIKYLQTNKSILVLYFCNYSSFFTPQLA